MTFFSDDIAPEKTNHANCRCPCTCEHGGTCAYCVEMAAKTDPTPSLRPESRTWFDDVLKFVKGAQGEKAIPESLTFEAETVDLYWKLIEEEYMEMRQGFAERDPVEFADGIADLIWVLMGLAIAAGIDLRPVWAEVARANLDKLGGPRRADGKLMKPEGWRPPDVLAALRRGRLR